MFYDADCKSSTAHRKGEGRQAKKGGGGTQKGGEGQAKRGGGGTQKGGRGEPRKGGRETQKRGERNPEKGGGVPKKGRKGCLFLNHFLTWAVHRFQPHGVENCNILFWIYIFQPLEVYKFTSIFNHLRCTKMVTYRLPISSAERLSGALHGV